jgi:hypothetical protein
MSALGQKRTSRSVEAMSALPPKADIVLRIARGCGQAARAFAEAVIRSVELIVQPAAKDVVGEMSLHCRRPGAEYPGAAC